MADDGNAANGTGGEGGPTALPRLHEDDIKKIAEVVNEMIKANPVSRDDDTLPTPGDRGNCLGN